VATGLANTADHQLHGTLWMNGCNVPLLLSHNAIYLCDWGDILHWNWNRSTGILTTRLGYEALTYLSLPRERV